MISPSSSRRRPTSSSISHMTSSWPQALGIWMRSSRNFFLGVLPLRKLSSLSEELNIQLGQNYANNGVKKPCRSDDGVL